MISDNDPDGIAPTVALSSDNPQPMPMTPFGAILTKQMDSDGLRSLNKGSGVVGVPNETVVKEVSVFFKFNIYIFRRFCSFFIQMLKDDF